MLLNRIAWMYYYGHMKQQEIAVHLNISRVTVNRLLKQAQKEGVVEITIKPEYLKMYEYEDFLREKANLEYVVVVPDTNDIEDSLCRGTAHLFNDVLDSKGKLGIGLSKTLKSLYKYIKEGSTHFDAIVSICGTSYPDLSMTPLNVGFTLSEALKIPYYTIWAPVLVMEEESSDLIKRDIYIAKILKMAASVNYAIIGIGGVDSSRLTESGYISNAQIREVVDKGAIAEVIGNYFDIKGNRIKTSITSRLISVDFPMKCPVIGVAGGNEKVTSILGTIRSGIIQGLIVNESVAEELIKKL